MEGIKAELGCGDSSTSSPCSRIAGKGSIRISLSWISLISVSVEVDGATQDGILSSHLERSAAVFELSRAVVGFVARVVDVSEGAVMPIIITLLGRESVKFIVRIPMSTCLATIRHSFDR